MKKIDLEEIRRAYAGRGHGVTSEQSSEPRLPPIGSLRTLVFFASGALLLLGMTHRVIPIVSEVFGVERVLSWFLVGGLGVFLPLLVAAFLIVRGESPRAEGRPMWLRLRFHRMTRADWLWSAGALLAIAALTAGLQFGLRAAMGEVRMEPEFMSFEALSSGRYWILAVWIPFWLLNIVGEEVLWRGVVLPRQEVSFGPRAWLANGAGWLLFHLAFGWQLMVMLLPIVFILPWVVQQRRSSTVGLVIHAGINGPGFIAVALGAV